MTFPSVEAYTAGVGLTPLIGFVITNYDPTPNNTGYNVQQKWINNITQGIWVLEKYVNGKAQWRALAPTVLQTRDPTTADYEYPLSQPWVNTTTPSIWFLALVTGTTATWLQLVSGSGNGVLTINTVAPDGSGNFTLTAGQSITLTPGVASETISANLATAAGTSVLSNAGVASFQTSQFAVDGNGFVTLNGSGVLSTLSDDVGTSITPSAGNIQLVGHIVEQGATKFSTVVPEAI